MPPPIPRAPLRALSRPTASTVRHFTTTSTLASDVPIPPESPRFIPLPNLPQSDETKKPPVRGTLPVPREIFTKRAHKDHKLSGDFVADTAPYSQAQLRGDEPKSEKEAWRRAMAESRRQALGGGIDSLWRRKVHRESRAKARADAHARRNLADKFAPERPEDVYTRGTIPAGTLDTRVVRDPDYAERQAESAARTAALQVAKSQARKDAVQRLYVEASSFILTEDELAAKVNDIFTEDYFRKKGLSRAMFVGAENVWEAAGTPNTVRQMFYEMTRSSAPQAPDSTRDSSAKTTQRQKIVAGELTGGALSVDQPPEKIE